MNNHVDRPVLQQEFAALKAFRELLPNRLLDDIRPRKARERVGLSNIDIAQ